MKRLFLLFTFLITFSYVSAEPIPEMRPSAPDVRSEVQGEPMEYQKPEEKSDNSSGNQEDEYDDEEYEEDSTEIQENKDASKVENSQQNTQNTPEDEEILKDIKQLNEPEKTTESTLKKTTPQKVNKVKKEKTKYGKYKDAENDPYIQSWEEELKRINSGNANLSEEEKQKQQEEAQKSYSQSDYEQAYRDMPVPTFSFVHGVDPDQYYDMKDTTWSPYPLLRLNSPLYFKTITIEPGYYLLTPRQYKDDWYILFKESGSIKYTVPVFDKSFTPEFYYRDNLKEADMSRSARWQLKFLNAWGKYIRKSKRRPATKCNIELTDLDNNFLLLELYYGPHKYSTIFRIEKF